MKSDRRVLVLFLVLFTCAMVSCRPSGEGEGPYRAFEFRVDSTLLGSTAAIGPFTFRVPAHWDQADSSLLILVRNAVQQDTGRFAVELEDVYLNAQDGGLLLMTRFSTPPTKTEKFTGWARAFVEDYRTARPGLKLKEEWMLLGDVRAVQLYSEDSVRVQFKYLLDASPVIGLDFSVPLTAWKAEVRGIESALGTLRKTRS